MKTIRKINLKELQGVEMTRPELKFLVGGCGSSGKKKICCNPNNGSCSSETTADNCDGSPCGEGVPFNCW